MGDFGLELSQLKVCFLSIDCLLGFGWLFLRDSLCIACVIVEPA